MINQVALTGRLTRDAVLRYTDKGNAVATFTVATNRRYTDSDGNRQADYTNCVIWKKSAENLANFTSKGSLVGIEGRLQSRSYENQAGQRIFVTEVLVENFTLLESRADGEQRKSSNAAADVVTDTEVDKMPSSPFDNGQEIDISDDDLPF